MSSHFKVVVTDFLVPPLEHEIGILGDIAAVEALGASHEDELAGRMEDADALLIYHQEPPRDDDPLVAAWRDPGHPAYHRLIINPHAAFYSQEGLLDIRLKGAEACRRALLGLPLRNVVN